MDHLKVLSILIWYQLEDNVLNFQLVFIIEEGENIYF